MTMASLTTTLLHYLKEEHLEKVPVWRMISMPSDTIKTRAEAWQGQVGRGSFVVATKSTIGGGSLPGDTLPSWALQLRASDDSSVDSLAQALRTSPTPVIGRIEDDALLLDPRTVLPDQEPALLDSVTRALSSSPD